MNSRLYDWASVMAAQILNLHFDQGEPKCEQYQVILFLLLDGLYLSQAELREAMLTPSEN